MEISDEELIERYERKKDYVINFRFYECEEIFTLEEVIRLAKLIQIEEQDT